MSSITNFDKCKKILQNDFSSIKDINKLLEYKVCLIDSYNFAFRHNEFGTTKESLERGFIIPIEDSAAQGFSSKDPFMSVNIQNAIKNIDDRLDFLNFQANKIEFLDYIQKNEMDLKRAENEKSIFKENEVITVEELGRNISVELANVMFKCGFSYMVISKQESFEKYKEELFNILEVNIDDMSESAENIYDELISQIEYAKENLEKVEMFKVRDFYCDFVNAKENIKDSSVELDVFINQNDDLIKVNKLFISEPNIEQASKYIQEVMCAEIGKITKEGKIEKEYHGQGYIYKNFENFYKREGICYVSEYDGDSIETGGISYSGIWEDVCDYLVLCGVDLTKVQDRIIEGMVEDIFQTVDWQFTSSLIMGDEYLCGYVEEFPDEYFREDAPENMESESR